MLIAILAGGKGSRFSKFSNKPKILISFKKKTLLDNFIYQLKEFKFKNKFLFLGHKSDEVIKYLKKKRIKINYFVEKKPLGTGGALKNFENHENEDALVIMGDILLDIDYKKFIAFHKKKKSETTLFVHPNTHPHDSDLVTVNKNMKVTNFFSKNKRKRPYTRNLTTAGVYLINLKLLKKLKKNVFQDLSSHLIIPALKKKNHKVFAYYSREYVKDVGTPKRYFEALKDFKNKIPQKRNLNKKMPAIFLDRDGTLNREKYNVYSNPCNLFSKTIEAIKIINKKNYLSIIISNQPAIAKGFVKQKHVEFTHSKLETMLGHSGAYIDEILYCPHHPKKGFRGEIKSLKVKCECRKPRIGLIKLAEKKFNIDLKKSIFIGNSMVDYETAINAGIKPMIINNKILSKELKQKKHFKSIYECISSIFNKNSKKI